MAIKKSELYSSLWKSCDELRGGMDASQYKDYVLVLLFVKYVSDKYAGQKDALLDVPKGGSFADMVALKGDKEIGDKMNKIISRLVFCVPIGFVARRPPFRCKCQCGNFFSSQIRETPRCLVSLTISSSICCLRFNKQSNYPIAPTSVWVISICADGKGLMVTSSVGQVAKETVAGFS
jgi:hypothetical protein